MRKTMGKSAAMVSGVKKYKISNTEREELCFNPSMMLEFFYSLTV